MRRATILVPTVVLIALMAVAPVLTGARQTTPTAGGSAGVTGGPLGGGEPEAAPGHVLWLRYGTFEPGGSVDLHHHPGALVLYVESGSLTYDVAEGVAIVTRAATDSTPDPPEEIGPGMVTVLNAGDAVFEQGVVHTARNDGDEPTDVLIAALADADEPFTIYHDPAP